MRHKRSAINLIAAISYQFVNTLLGLLLPYLFITEFGSETNGLLSSVTQLFVYVNLLEGGVGGATVQALYNPISRNDRQNICEIMSATSQYYLKTGAWYGAFVILLSFIYPLVVSTKLSNETVRMIILLQGASGVWSYLVQGKYSLLLKADGRMYILNVLMMCTSILRNAGKIWAIASGYDIIAVQMIHLVITILQSGFVVAYAKHNYKWLNFKAAPDFDAIAQRGAVLVQQLAWLVFNHTDVIMLTMIGRDLVLVSIYSLYTLVFDAIQNVIETASKSIQFRLGEYSQKSRQAFSEYCLKYRKTYIFLVVSLLTTTYLLLRPFIRIYVRNVTDGNYLMQYLPELFFACRLLYSMRDLNLQIMNAVGHFRAAKKIAIAEAGLNLIVSLCMVPFFSIYGVLSGTIIALLFSCIAYTWYTNRIVLGGNQKQFYSCAEANGIVMLGVCWLGKQTIPAIETSYIDWILAAIPLTAIVFGIFGLVYICSLKCKQI